MADGTPLAPKGDRPRLRTPSRPPAPDPEMGRWLEEYKTCSCTLVAARRDELPGYCQIHGNSRRRVMKLLSPAKVGHSKQA